MNIKTDLSPRQILAISEQAPEKLFTGNLEIAKSEYRLLGRHWHPDHNSDAQSPQVFQHISKLYRLTQELLNANRWRGAGTLELGNSDGVFRRIPYLRIVPFELGEMYVGEREVVFAVERQYGDLFENAKKQIAGLKFADAGMKREIARCLPPVPTYFATADRLLMVLSKTPDLILLDDLRIFLGGRIEPTHVGWIQSVLHNLSCYLGYANLVHHDISPQTVFVSPQFHTGALLGGWWYARQTGDKIPALPARTIQNAPPDVLRDKRADGRTDLELIRATGRELLGDPGGGHLSADKNVPSAFAGWLNGATNGDPVREYQLWKEVLQKSFGAPRFVKLNINVGEIYG